MLKLHLDQNLFRGGSVWVVHLDFAAWTLKLHLNLRYRMTQPSFVNIKVPILNELRYETHGYNLK